MSNHLKLLQILVCNHFRILKHPHCVSYAIKTHFKKALEGEIGLKINLLTNF